MSARCRREDRAGDLEARPPRLPGSRGATADLKAFRERAYPYLLKATKSDDPEVGRRADEALKFIQGRVPAAQLEPRDNDVVYTDDSRITGKLTAQALHVNTSQFGDQSLRLADMRSLRSGMGSVADDAQNWPTAPANLMTYQQQYGKEMTFTLTGYTSTGGQPPSIWGTDVYTLDSHLAAAAVHAGIVKPGETGTRARANRSIAAPVRGELPQWRDHDRLQRLQRRSVRVREEVTPSEPGASATGGSSSGR